MQQIFNVGVNPASIAIDHKGKYGYVTNGNFYDIPGEYTVTVLDLRKGLPKTTIHDDSFDEPYRSAIDHHDRYLYVCNSGSPKIVGEQGTVSVIDTKTNKVVDVIEGFDGPGGIVLSNKYGYVTNYGAHGGIGDGNGKTVSVFDLKKRVIVDTIDVDLAPAALVLNNDFKYLYVVCYVDGKPGTGVLDIIDTKTNHVINRIPGLFGPFGVILSRDNLAYVTNFGSNDFSPFSTAISVIDLKKNKIIRNIETGIQPSGISISKNQEYVFVSNYNTLYAKPNFQSLTPGTGSVSIIRTRDNKLITPTIPVGQTPSTLAISPDGKRLYVCGYVQNIVIGVSLDFLTESCDKNID